MSDARSLGSDEPGPRKDLQSQANQAAVEVHEFHSIIVDKASAGLLEIREDPSHDSDILDLLTELYALAHTVPRNGVFCHVGRRGEKCALLRSARLLKRLMGIRVRNECVISESARRSRLCGPGLTA